jgi:hypothetical protein
METVEDEFGNKYRQLDVYYNVKASAPTGDAATDEASPTPKEITIACTVSPNNLVQDADGVPVSEYHLRENADNKALIDLAYSQIILPDTENPQGDSTVGAAIVGTSVIA